MARFLPLIIASCAEPIVACLDSGGSDAIFAAGAVIRGATDKKENGGRYKTYRRGAFPTADHRP